MSDETRSRDREVAKQICDLIENDNHIVTFNSGDSELHDSAVDGIRAALLPLEKIAGDLSNCPIDSAEVKRARDVPENDSSVFTEPDEECPIHRNTVNHMRRVRVLEEMRRKGGLIP